MVPADSWRYGSFGSAFKFVPTPAPTPAPARPIAIFVENAELQYPDPPAPAPKVTAGADYSVIAAAPVSDFPATGDTSFAPSYEVEAVPVPTPTPVPALAPVSPPHRKFEMRLSFIWMLTFVDSVNFLCSGGSRRAISVAALESGCRSWEPVDGVHDRCRHCTSHQPDFMPPAFFLRPIEA
jgi:hypothetical protein